MHHQLSFLNNPYLNSLELSMLRIEVLQEFLQELQQNYKLLIYCKYAFEAHT